MEGELRLQVRLLEVRVDAARIRRLEVRVHIDAPVGQILRTLQPAAIGVLAVGDHPEFVVLGQPGQLDPPVRVCGRRVDGRTVKRDLVHRIGYQIGIAGRSWLDAVEPDRRGRPECLRTAR